MSIMDSVYQGVSYLIIVEKKAESSNSGFERGEGICRLLRCTEDHFCCCRCSGLPHLKCVFIWSIGFTVIGIRSISNLIENCGAAYVVWRILSEVELKINRSRTVRLPDMRSRRRRRGGTDIEKGNFLPIDVTPLSAGITPHHVLNAKI